MTKSLKESTNCGMYNLSNTLFSQFLTSPPKFLLRMKSVCSMWWNMVSSPLFIKNHLDIANNVHNFHKVRYINTDEAPMIQSTTLEGKEARYENTNPKTTFSSNVEIFGSCNGLILLGDNLRTYYLWNPSTRSCREFNGPFVFKGELRNIALGYDSKTSSYKVVRILRVASCKEELSKMGGLRSSFYDKKNYDATTAKVYNCKTSSWDEIKDFPYVIFEEASGVTVNGFPHWVMLKKRGQDKVLELVIVYFDLSEEIFKEICIPHWLVPSSKYEFGVFEEKLCFIHYTRPSYELWVMPKHGECWIKLSVDVTHVRLPGWSHIDYITGLFNHKAFSRAMYVESLVSPLGGKDMVG
ncbi:F-box associated domain, type 1 [Artemisia annua]|uniref:F-box associated domain, type 1 n=1 Tax=Artemisia annua TaxID=35608 RepID=A0A2U1PDD9_ARTAN|nr:F-box associated domain, type 1 [Artemisia annua]